jgi:lipid-binding SYLF domain-containing protein
MNAAGAVVRLDKKQNAELYGEGAAPEQVLNIQLTKRPPPFDRLVKVRAEANAGSVWMVGRRAGAVA